MTTTDSLEAPTRGLVSLALQNLWNSSRFASNCSSLVRDDP
jgi:hypothetical protein